VTPLTDTQKRLVGGLVRLFRNKEIGESFTVCRSQNGEGMLVMNSSGKTTDLLDGVTPQTFQALERAGLVLLREIQARFGLMECTLTGAAFGAVDEQSNATHASDLPSESKAASAATTTASAAKPANRKDVWVVHGRDERLRQSLFAFLRALALNPLEWEMALARTKKGAPYIGEVLDAAFAEAGAVIVLLSADDEARLKPAFRKESDGPEETELTGQPRANVIFEAGMAFGRHDDRTILVQVGSIRPFSDVGGRHVIRLSNEMASRQALANRLRTIGCDVDLTGTDWHREGDFAADQQGSDLKPLSTSTPSVKSRDRTELEQQILLWLIDHANATASGIATQLSTSGQKVRFHLEELERDGFIIGSHFYTGQPSRYQIGHEGRRYLIERNLL
jgi:predicted nucleotide-binding protein